MFKKQTHKNRSYNQLTTVLAHAITICTFVFVFVFAKLSQVRTHGGKVILGGRTKLGGRIDL